VKDREYSGKGSIQQTAQRLNLTFALSCNFHPVNIHHLYPDYSLHLVALHIKITQKIWKKSEEREFT